MEEENIAYDHGPIPVGKQVSHHKARRRKTPEVRGPDQLPEQVKENMKLAIRISGTDTLGGMYALMLVSLGIAFPVSEYTSSREDARMRDNFDIGFALYVYIISLIFQTYITMAVLIQKRRKHQHRTPSISAKPDALEVETSFGGTHQRQKTGSKGEIYVIDDSGENKEKSAPQVRDSHLDLPWHYWHRLAPPIYETKYGFNLFSRSGILVFGVSAVVLEICRLVEYTRPSNQGCYTDVLKILTVVRILFFTVQSLFLIIHHKVVVNFHHPVMKIGLLHLVSANIVAWIKMVAHGAIDVIVLDAINPAAQQYRVNTSSHNANNTHTADTLADKMCLGNESIAVIASRYLAPLIIGYCLLAAAIIYRMYLDLGPEPFLIPLRSEIWERDCAALTSADGEDKKCIRPNLGLVFGVPLFLVTLGITCYVVFLDLHKLDRTNLKIQGRVHVTCDLFWNLVTLIALVPSFYSLHKLKYVKTVGGGIERILIGTLGGTYILLGFMTIASFMYINDPTFGGPAKMAVPGCVMNFIQSGAMLAFTIDAWRRRLIDLQRNDGKDCITFLIIANLSMWVVTSFQWKTSFGSDLFFIRFGVLPWVLIINSTLPLAMFFRFMTCVALTDVLRTTYGLHVRRKLAFRAY